MRQWSTIVARAAGIFYLLLAWPGSWSPGSTIRGRGRGSSWAVRAEPGAEPPAPVVGVGALLVPARPSAHRVWGWVVAAVFGVLAFLGFATVGELETGVLAISRGDSLLYLGNALTGLAVAMWLDPRLGRVPGRRPNTEPQPPGDPPR